MRPRVVTIARSTDGYMPWRCAELLEAAVLQTLYGNFDIILGSISHRFLSSPSPPPPPARPPRAAPHAHLVICSTNRPCLSDAVWCLQSDRAVL